MWPFRESTGLNLLFAAGICILVYISLYLIIRAVSRDPRNILPVNFIRRIHIPLFIFLLSILLQVSYVTELLDTIRLGGLLLHMGRLGLILSLTWFAIVILKVVKFRVIRLYDIKEDDNLRARKVYTQFNLLENSIIFVIILIAIGVALMSFESIRSIGVTLLTSAGIAGIIIGLAAQKVLGALFAGIQIAITQPIRYNDVVIVEGEWGWIEEIRLTYVVVRIWDKRRLVVPSTYFIENVFQNWTRTTSDILGTVFIYTDYTIQIEPLRKELTRLLEASEHWDGQVNVLQVTNATGQSMELRALMSAKDSPTAWDLRVEIREKLLHFIQKHYPESLPRTRLELDKLSDKRMPARDE